MTRFLIVATPVHGGITPMLACDARSPVRQGRWTWA